jgi:AICAR transformylase/IMP cyclohydrolase PurH
MDDAVNLIAEFKMMAQLCHLKHNNACGLAKNFN